MKAKIIILHGYNTPTHAEIMPQYQSLDSRERGKLRLM
jgi:hypothetical protein